MLQGCVRDVRAFGSLVRSRGRLFRPDESDIDLLILLDGAVPFSERVRAMGALLDGIGTLETTLRSLMMRSADAPIISTLVVTGHELAGDVHKSSARRFFSDQETEFVSIACNGPPPPFPPRSNMSHEYLEPLAAVQKFRNEYLRVDAHGHRHCESYSESAFGVPKDLARAAASIRAVERGGDRVAVDKGGFYVALLLDEAEGDDVVRPVFERVLSRFGLGASDATELSALDQLICWELLADAAYRKLRANGAPFVVSTPTFVVAPAAVDKAVEEIISSHGVSDLAELTRAEILQVTGSMAAGDIRVGPAMETLENTNLRVWRKWVSQGGGEMVFRSERTALAESVDERLDAELEKRDGAAKEMRSWFFEHYEDPANGVSYDTQEGGYQYFNGGPVDPWDVLADQFSGTYPDALIEEVATDIAGEFGSEFVAVGDY